jgi:SPP1 gp7 family putative phage head morphogenesis protein
MPEYGSRPFTEAIDYFNQKRPLPTTGWRDVYGPQHDHAVMVAGANKAAIVESFASAIQGAIESGETLADFRKRFDDIVSTHGWDYKGSRGWRTRLIYETNIRQAYNAGREAQMADPQFQQRFPYMEYRHSGAENYRPQHKAWDGLVLRADDPWWNVHSPSNGYGCKCKKFPVSRRQMARRGKSGPDTAPPDKHREFIDERTGEVKQIPLGIDPGFEHRPGSSWLRSLTPGYRADWPKSAEAIPFGPAAKPPMPAPTPVSADVLLEDGLPDERYVSAFLNEFGANGAMIFSDVLGEPIAINDYLFRGADGRYKVSKDKIRHRYMRLLARTITQPDEIWALLEPDIKTPGKYRIKRRYLKRWVLEEDGQVIQGVSAFELGQGVWTGSTTFTPHRKLKGQKVPENEAYLQRQREGVHLYTRQEEE